MRGRRSESDRAICRPAPSSRSPIPTASPRAAAAGGAFLLANGRGANVDPASALAREPFLAVAELTGTAAQSRILLAAPITLDEIEARFADRIEARDEITFDAGVGEPARAPQRTARRARAGRAGRCRSRPTPRPRACSPKASSRLGLDRLPWSKALQQWRDRVMFLRRAEGDEWPDLSDDGARRAAPPTGSRRCSPARPRSSQLGADELADARARRCCRGICAAGSTPRRRRISPRRPARRCRSTTRPRRGRSSSIRVQELFGLDQHPAIAGGRVPLVVELLSPAHRPVQVTRDLPGFWRGSYAAVKTEMRGRYPRHPWPDDPLHAPATRRAKPRGT